MRKIASILAVSLMFLTLNPSSFSAGPVRVNVTVLIASNEGNEYDLVNDDYKDQLIGLFSYSSYHQLNEFSKNLTLNQSERINLPEGYELVLTLQGEEDGRVLIQAGINKENQEYLDTVLSVLRPGVVFVGGPRVKVGAIIIALETVF
jgi:hypothetical protein